MHQEKREVPVKKERNALYYLLHNSSANKMLYDCLTTSQIPPALGTKKVVKENKEMTMGMEVIHANSRRHSIGLRMMLMTRLMMKRMTSSEVLAVPPMAIPIPTTPKADPFEMVCGDLQSQWSSEFLCILTVIVCRNVGRGVEQVVSTAIHLQAPVDLRELFHRIRSVHDAMMLFATRNQPAAWNSQHLWNRVCTTVSNKQWLALSLSNLCCARARKYIFHHLISPSIDYISLIYSVYLRSPAGFTISFWWEPNRWHHEIYAQKYMGLLSQQ